MLLGKLVQSNLNKSGFIGLFYLFGFVKENAKGQPKERGKK